MAALTEVQNRAVGSRNMRGYQRTFAPNIGTLAAGAWNTTGASIPAYTAYLDVYGTSLSPVGAGLILPTGATSILSTGAGSVFAWNAQTVGIVQVVGEIVQLHIEISLNTSAASPGFTVGRELRIFGGETVIPKPKIRAPRFDVHFVNGYGAESHLLAGNYKAELLDNGSLQLLVEPSLAASATAMTVANLTTIVVWAVANNFTRILIDGSYVAQA